MKEFKRFHPIVNFIFFAAVIVFNMLFMHPAYLAMSFFSVFTYSILLKEGKNSIFISALIIILSGLINSLFNHKGVTILFYLPSENPVTFEAIMFGVASGTMLCNVVLWFACYNKVFTSDKFIYLFGKIIPSLSLVLSMTLRFVSKFKNRLKSVIAGQRSIGKASSKAKRGADILSVLVTWALEDSVDSSDSMKNRGYGLPGRTAFSIYKFSLRDLIMLLLIIVLSLTVILTYSGFNYYPVIEGETNLVMLVAYILLCNIPLSIEVWEGAKWKYLKSKI